MRYASFILIIIFFFSSTVLAYTRDVNFWAQRQMQITPPPQERPQIHPQIKGLSNQFGTVHKIIPGNSDQAIYHIQDIHLHDEAQENIRAIIENLISQRNVDLVALEGVFKPLDYSSFHDFDDPTLITHVADYLLKTQKISGAIHAMLSPLSTEIPLVGIDDKAHYDANVAAVLHAIETREAIKEELIRKQKRLRMQRKKILNKSLLEFFDLQEAYRSGAMNLADYVKSLTVLSNEHYSTLESFLAAIHLESAIDYDRVEIERSVVMGQLLRRIDKEKTRHLIRLSEGVRNGTASELMFYQDLLALVNANEIKLANFKNLKSYTQYLHLVKHMNGERLFDEVSQLEQECVRRFIQSPRETQFIEENDAVYFQLKLVDFSLTQSEWAHYKSQDPVLAPYENFYKQAELRDVEMARNLKKAIRTHKSKNIVLVTGGFHSNGIQVKFHGDNQPTIIQIVPKITHVHLKDKTKYLSAFAQEKSPLEEILEGEKLFLTPNPAKGVPYIPIFTSVLQFAKDQSRKAQDTLMRFWPQVAQRVSLVAEPNGNNNWIASIQNRLGQVRMGFNLNPDGSIRDIQEPVPGKIPGWKIWEEELVYRLSTNGFVMASFLHGLLSAKPGSIGIGFVVIHTVLLILTMLGSSILYGEKHRDKYNFLTGNVFTDDEIQRLKQWGESQTWLLGSIMFFVGIILDVHRAVFIPTADVDNLIVFISYLISFLVVVSKHKRMNKRAEDILRPKLKPRYDLSVPDKLQSGELTSPIYNEFKLIGDQLMEKIEERNIDASDGYLPKDLKEWTRETAKISMGKFLTANENPAQWSDLLVHGLAIILNDEDPHHVANKVVAIEILTNSMDFILEDESLPLNDLIYFGMVGSGLPGMVLFTLLVQRFRENFGEEGEGIPEPTAMVEFLRVVYDELPTLLLHVNHYSHLHDSDFHANYLKGKRYLEEPPQEEKGNIPKINASKLLVKLGQADNFQLLLAAIFGPRHQSPYSFGQSEKDVDDMMPYIFKLLKEMANEDEDLQEIVSKSIMMYLNDHFSAAMKLKLGSDGLEPIIDTKVSEYVSDLQDQGMIPEGQDNEDNQRQWALQSFIKLALKAGIKKELVLKNAVDFVFLFGMGISQVQKMTQGMVQLSISHTRFVAFLKEEGFTEDEILNVIFSNEDINYNENALANVFAMILESELPLSKAAPLALKAGASETDIIIGLIFSVGRYNLNLSDESKIPIDVSILSRDILNWIEEGGDERVAKMNHIFEEYAGVYEPDEWNRLYRSVQLDKVNARFPEASTLVETLQTNQFPFGNFTDAEIEKLRPVPWFAPFEFYGDPNMFKMNMHIEAQNTRMHDMGDFALILIRTPDNYMPYGRFGLDLTVQIIPKTIEAAQVLQRINQLVIPIRRVDSGEVYPISLVLFRPQMGFATQAATALKDEFDNPLDPTILREGTLQGTVETYIPYEDSFDYDFVLDGADMKAFLGLRPESQEDPYQLPNSNLLALGFTLTYPLWYMGVFWGDPVSWLLAVKVFLYFRAFIFMTVLTNELGHLFRDRRFSATELKRIPVALFGSLHLYDKADPIWKKGWDVIWKVLLGVEIQNTHVTSRYPSKHTGDIEEILRSAQLEVVDDRIIPFLGALEDNLPDFAEKLNSNYFEVLDRITDGTLDGEDFDRLFNSAEYNDSEGQIGPLTPEMREAIMEQFQNSIILEEGMSLGNVEFFGFGEEEDQDEDSEDDDTQSPNEEAEDGEDEEESDMVLLKKAALDLRKALAESYQHKSWYASVAGWGLILNILVGLFGLSQYLISLAVWGPSADFSVYLYFIPQFLLFVFFYGLDLFRLALTDATVARRGLVLPYGRHHASHQEIEEALPKPRSKDVGKIWVYPESLPAPQPVDEQLKEEFIERRRFGRQA